MVNVTPEQQQQQQQVVVEETVEETVEQTTPTTLASLAPLTRPGVHVVTEVAIWFVALVGIEFFTRGSGIGFVGIEPNPLWFPVVWAALRGGLVIGLFTAFAAALLHAVGYAAIVGFDASLIVSPAVTWPLGLFAGVAFLVGQARDKIESDRRLARQLASRWQHEAGQQQTDLDMLQHVNRELKRRIFDRSFDFQSLMSTVASSTDGHAEKSFDVPLGMLVDFCGASKCSVLYVLPDGVIDLAAHRGWDEDDMLTRLQSMRHNHRVQRALVEARPIVTLSDADVERSGPLLVAPLADATGVIKALLCIDDLSPARFDQATVKTFLGIATWVATNLRRIEVGGVNEETWQSVQEMLNTSKVIGTPEAFAERIFLEDARRTRYGVETVLVAVRMVDTRSGREEHAEELESFLSKVASSVVRLTDDVFRFGFAGCYVVLLTNCQTEHAEAVVRRLSERFQARAGCELEEVDLRVFAPGQDAANLAALLPAITQHFFGAPMAGIDQRCPVPEPCAQRSGDAKDFVRRLRLEMDLAKRLEQDLSVCDFRGGEQAFGVGPMIARHLWNLVGKLLRVTDGIYVLGPNRCVVLLPCTTCLDATRIWQRLDEELGRTLPDGRYETVQSDFLALTDVDSKAALMHLIGASDVDAQPSFEPILSDNELGFLSFTDSEFSSMKENTDFKDGEMTNSADDIAPDENVPPGLLHQQPAAGEPAATDPANVTNPEVVDALEAVLGKENELVRDAEHNSEDESELDEHLQQLDPPGVSAHATQLAGEQRSLGHFEDQLAEAATAMRREADEMHRQLNREAVSLREEIGAATAALREQTDKILHTQIPSSHKAAPDEELEATRTQITESLRCELDRSLAAAADKAIKQEQDLADLRRELARVVASVGEGSAKQPERVLPASDDHLEHGSRENLAVQNGVGEVGAGAVDEIKLQLHKAIAAIKVDAVNDLREELEAMAAGIRASEGHALQSELARQIKVIRDHVLESPHADPEPDTSGVAASCADALRDLPGELGVAADEVHGKTLAELQAEPERSVEQVRQRAAVSARAEVEALGANHHTKKTDDLMRRDLIAPAFEMLAAADKALSADLFATGSVPREQAADALRQELEREALILRMQAEETLRTELGAVVQAIAQEAEKRLNERLNVVAAAQGERATETLSQEIETLGAEHRTKAADQMRRDLSKAAVEIREAADKALSDDLLATGHAAQEQASDALRQELEREAMALRKHAEDALHQDLGAVAQGIAQEADERLNERLDGVAVAQGERATESLTQEIEALGAEHRTKAGDQMRRDLSAAAAEIRAAADKVLFDDLLATSNAAREQASDELRQELESEGAAVREQAASELGSDLDAVARALTEGASQLLAESLGAAALANREQTSETLCKDLQTVAETIGQDLGDQLRDKIELDVAAIHERSNAELRSDLEATVAAIRAAALANLSSVLDQTAGERLVDASERLCDELEGFIAGIDKGTLPTAAIDLHADGSSERAEKWSRLHERMVALKAGFDSIQRDDGAHLPGGFPGIAVEMLKQAQSYASSNRAGSSGAPVDQDEERRPQ